ncbi:helix-turn-helix domain-containing protein [Enterococcus termitis]|uniref:Mga helix-turn-helix domain-containing protein n=1 Tax=Enterococcus termitis TaxID=332950 RepID=A0A1E5GJJ5_9ENTE|nr:helix-turn-helix domain-containing protein [Enterococcus termitis]OEG12868.1 hypothetical protein BCR25_05085 [Enterococcus termitis]OJG96619.1 hypothetical protein RV18_GL002053 [Enterococcus termitis]
MLTLLDSNEKRIINELWLMDLNNGSMPLNLLKEQIGCSLNTLKNDLTQLDSQWYDILDVRIDENQIVHINHLSNGTIDQLLTSLLYNNVNLKILLLLFKETKRDATYYVEQVYCSLPTFYRSIKKLEKFFKGLPIKLVKKNNVFYIEAEAGEHELRHFFTFLFIGFYRRRLLEFIPNYYQLRQQIQEELIPNDRKPSEQMVVFLTVLYFVSMWRENQGYHLDETTTTDSHERLKQKLSAYFYGWDSEAELERVLHVASDFSREFVSRFDATWEEVHEYLQEMLLEFYLNHKQFPYATDSIVDRLKMFNRLFAFRNPVIHSALFQMCSTYLNQLELNEPIFLDTLISEISMKFPFLIDRKITLSIGVLSDFSKTHADFIVNRLKDRSQHLGIIDFKVEGFYHREEIEFSNYDLIVSTVQLQDIPCPLFIIEDYPGEYQFYQFNEFIKKIAQDKFEHMQED